MFSYVAKPLILSLCRALPGGTFQHSLCICCRVLATSLAIASWALVVLDSGANRLGLPQPCWRLHCSARRELLHWIQAVLPATPRNGSGCNPPAGATVPAGNRRRGPAAPKRRALAVTSRQRRSSRRVSASDAFDAVLHGPRGVHWSLACLVDGTDSDIHREPPHLASRHRDKDLVRLW